NHGHKAFVSEEVPGYNEDTKSKVVPPPGTPVALVEVPATAVAQTNGSEQTFANELDRMTGHRDVIAVAFVAPDKPASYKTSTVRISQEVSDRLMRTASGIGADAGDVLTSFGNSVTQYLADNPGSLRPVPKPTGSGATGPGAQKQGTGSKSGIS